MLKTIYNDFNTIISKYAIIILIIVGYYCYNNKTISPYENAPASYARSGGGMAKMAMMNADTSSNGRMYVENNSIEIAAKNVDKTKEKIDLELKNINGKLESLYSNKYYNKQSFNITYRIPNDKLNSFIEFLKIQGKVKNQNFSINEVSKEYKNNENRMKSLNTRKARLEELLKNKTSTADNLLNLERELNSIQDQIMYLENTLKSTEQDIKFSTVRLTIVPEKYIIYPDGQEWSFNSAFNKVLVNFILFSQKVATFLLYFIIFSPYLLLAWLIKKIFNK